MATLQLMAITSWFHIMGRFNWVYFRTKRRMKKLRFVLKNGGGISMYFSDDNIFQHLSPPLLRWWLPVATGFYG